MAYWWLNIIIALTAGSVIALVLNSFWKNKRLIFSLSIVVTTLLAWVIAYLFITPYYKVATFEHQLKLQPAFEVMAVQQPANLQAFVTAARPLILKQKKPHQVRLLAERIAQRAFIKALHKAPNDAITAYLKAAISLYSKLLNQHPQLVLVLENPQKFADISIYDHNTAPFQQELNAFNHAKAAVITAAIKDPQASPEAFEIKYLVNIIWSNLTAKYGDDNVKLAFTQPTNPALTPELGAKIMLTYYQQVLKLGPNNAGKIMRFVAKS